MPVLKERSDKDWPLVPFSEGPAGCPGRNLVLLLASNMLASLLDGRSVAQGIALSRRSA